MGISRGSKVIHLVARNQKAVIIPHWISGKINIVGGISGKVNNS
jgi:hypothetical protein